MRWLGVDVGQKSEGGWEISYRRRADVRLGRVSAVVGYGLILLTRVDKEREGGRCVSWLVLLVGCVVG